VGSSPISGGNFCAFFYVNEILTTFSCTDGPLFAVIWVYNISIIDLHGNGLY